MQHLTKEEKIRSEQLLRELREMGEFRRGTVNVLHRRCGKPGCACAQEGHPGHGPLVTLTFAPEGKTRTRSLRRGLEEDLAREQVQHHDRFQDWVRRWVAFNEEVSESRLSEARSGSEESSPEKKTADYIQAEVEREISGLIGRLLAERSRSGSFDLEAMESLTKEVMLRCGGIVLQHVLAEEDGGSLGRNCACGGRFVDVKRAAKTVLTVVGPVPLLRRYQRCAGCGRRRVPEDRVLDIERTIFSPGVRRMMAETGSEVCFDRAKKMILKLAGLRVSAKEVERVAEAVGQEIGVGEDERVRASLAGEASDPSAAVSTLYIAADGTGVPVLRRETEGRKGKAADGVARTRESKLGAVFTQTSLDREGHPVRDPASTSYVGRIESSEDFGGRLYAEAVGRGLHRAARVVFLGDGAAWLWNLAEEHFPGAVQIVDYYHAAEHLGALAKGLYPEDEVGRKRWLKTVKTALWEGKVRQVIRILGCLGVRGKRKEAVVKTMAYFEKNQARMRYGEFRSQGLFIGSGVVEAGCKSLIGGRLKQSGMHWTVGGANAIISLRCCLESGRFEDYWESRCTG